MKEIIFKILIANSQIKWDGDMMNGTMITSPYYEKVANEIIEAIKPTLIEVYNSGVNYGLESTNNIDNPIVIRKGLDINETLNNIM